MDWKSLLGDIAPALGGVLSVFGGPVGILGSAALQAVSTAVLGHPNGTQDEVSQAIQAGLSPDAVAKVQQANNDFKLSMAQAGYKDKEVMATLEQGKIQTFVDDTKDARKYKDDKVFWLGVVILVTFAITMGMSIYGCYAILTGGITIKDVAVVAAVSGFVGSVVGYVAANAQQVVGYFFGSSAGSESKTNAMADTLKNVISAK